jgi:predicted PurR-regulated permease PerM
MKTIVGVGVLVAVCYFARTVLIVVTSALFIALTLAPVVHRLERLHIPRAVGAGLAVVLLSGAVAAMSVELSSQALAFVEQLQRQSREARQALSHLSGTAEAGPTTWASLARQAGGPLAELLLAISFLPFLSYFMLSWQVHAERATVRLFAPPERALAEETIRAVGGMVRRFLLGNLVTGLAIGVVSVVLYGAFKLPDFYFVGFLAGFLTLIPYLGGVVAPLLPFVAGFGRLGSTALVILVLSTLALHVFTLNVVYPKFLGSSLRLNPLAGTLALLVWAWLWGPIGLIFAIPITAAMKMVFERVERLQPWGAWLGPAA